tara:strand:+ start:6475 stop:6663 length:189 start_codon:yes stop_codon:yes gene_type:complete
MEAIKDRYIDSKVANTKWFACPICKTSRELYYCYEKKKMIYEWFPEVTTYGKDKVICDRCLD